LASRRRFSIQLQSNPELMPATPGLSHGDFVSVAKALVLKSLQDEQFSVESMAKELGLSRSGLFRRLKQEVDLSPAEFIRNIRLDCATSWLEAGAASISEVAYAAGFSSLSSFDRAFRQRFGLAPTEWQKRKALPGADQ
jgi:AraC-like DNA-binding protein